MKNINPVDLFDERFLLEKLTKLNDPLLKLEAHLDWKIFVPILDVVFNKPQNSSNAGWTPFDFFLHSREFFWGSATGMVSRFLSLSVRDHRIYPI
ncbi:MAG: hypothetical protein ACOYOE_03480 [Chlorobium sp.]